MQYLLDTNTCIAIMRNNAQVLARMQAATPVQCSISTITAFELFTGVAKCANPANERGKVAALLAVITEVAFDESAAREAAQLRADLEARGMTIGPYDLLLSGQAMARNLTLVTHNVAEFARVTGLVVEDWQS